MSKEKEQISIGELLEKTREAEKKIKAILLDLEQHGAIVDYIYLHRTQTIDSIRPELIGVSISLCVK